MSVQHDTGKETPFGVALKKAGFKGHRGRAEFGMKIGVDAVTVWRWAQGRSKPGSDVTRRAAASLLGKTTDEARVAELCAELWPSETAALPEAA